jgi:eukaryotic-like serine/threonine-protein kinase
MRCPLCGADSAGATCSVCGASLPGGESSVTPAGAQTIQAGLSGQTIQSDASGPTIQADPELTALPSGPSTPGGSSPGRKGMLVPGQAFGSRYRVVRQLGVGGMGAVYQAWDSELGVTVALKTIRPGSDLGAAAEIEQRFKRELLLAREVTHKNVVRIHDLGEIDGTKYITMSYVDGWSLSALLHARGKLPVPEALGIARQVASGLQAAHEAGVVHRDLKPANIMVNGAGHALILDFGIARLDSGGRQDAPAGPSGVVPSGRAAFLTEGTLSGTVIGTLEYMAPEQAHAGDVDSRADIYAFGLILRDLLVGLRKTGNPLEDLQERIEKGLPPLSTMDASLPETLDAIVWKCTQIDPAARYQTMDELCGVLGRLDDNGHLLPEPKRLTWRVVAAGVVLAAGLTGGGAWLLRPAPPPPVHDPMSVLVADFVNKTGDALFDGSLEQPFSAGIEGASFITAYPRRDALRAARRITPGTTKLDEGAARLVSQREAIKVVLTGVIEAAGSGFRISVRLVDPIPGTELARIERKAAGKPDVLPAIGALAEQAREALGDTVTQSERAAAVETFTTASLEAARDYAQAQALANANKDAEAIPLYKKALERDPNLGRAYSGWAASAVRLGQKDEAEQLYQKALALVDRMTEREKYRTLGAYYLNVAGNYEKAIENFEALVKKYPSDGAGHNNLAIAYFGTLNFPKALEEGRLVLTIYPNSPLYRSNYALYAMYAGDFATAGTEGRKMADQGDFLAYLPVAMAAMSGGRFDEATKAWDGAKSTGAQGASLAAIGLADMALAQARWRDAAGLLQSSIGADIADKNEVGAGAKAAALAEAQWALGRRKEALDAASRALKISRELQVVVPVARVLLDAGRAGDVAVLAQELDGQLQTQNRAYAHLLQAQLALARKQPAEAVDLLREGLKHGDLWLLRYTLGVGYVQAGASAEALSELDLCEKRRGETTALFLNDLPTYRYSVPLAYWLGRAQDGLGMREAAMRSYQSYLSMRPESSADPLAKDVAARLRALGASLP